MCGDEGAIRCFKETICQQIRGAHDFKIKLLQDTECFALKWLKTVVVIIYRYFVSCRLNLKKLEINPCWSCK